jgi:hypothetical protein
MELDLDPDALRAKYRAERERRIRPDGSRQYRHLSGGFDAYDEDPHADPEFTREPLHDRVEALIVGCGFGGPLLEELGHVPKWKYAPGEEIREHARAVARHFGLYEHACVPYGDGPVAFHELLRRWRAEGGVREVLVEGEA